MEYSPILALATAAFELLVAGWAFATRLRAKPRGVVATTGAILLLLAGYQIAEVAICDVSASGFLPRLAFIIVTWLPPLGLLLIAQLRRPRSGPTYLSAYAVLAAAAGIVVWIAIDRSFATASVCNAVYARYAHAMPRFRVYAGFYWVGLAAMALLSGRGAMTCRDLRRREQLVLLFAGTLAFVLPSIALSWFVPATRGALPSVLCHFALLLAAFLVRLVYLEGEAAPSPEGAVRPARV